MSCAQQCRQSSGAGFSLIEMLVASAIFAIVAAVAFIFFTAAQKSFKAGENATEQQQATRVAFDRLLADIRLAGYNTNPDGDASRVDEQVEGAWDTALTIRADFDFEDPVQRVTPESALAGSVYNIVSTGNDEIVTYVLAKPGPSGPGSLTLHADVDRPRAKSVKTITIPNVALVQDDPPYTLYRVTLRNVGGTFPAAPQAAAEFVYEPVAENIRSMTFSYLPDSGAPLGPDTPANPVDDIGGADAASVVRERIRRVSVSLVGMTPDEDLSYVDPNDATATTHYRKFDMTSDVNPENLGKSGVKDVDITPPPSPTGVTLVPGHCKGMLVKWDTPSSTSGVTQYGVKYWPSGAPSSFNTSAVTYPHNEFGVIDFDGHGFIAGLAQGTSYCFQVQARDLTGNQSGWAPGMPPCATVAEASTPDAPENLVATGSGQQSALDSRITLTWKEVRNNANDVTGDPDFINANTILRDGAGYKLYRDTTASFTPDDATNLIAGTSLLGAGVFTHTDTQVANCQTYYYKLKTADTCDIFSAASTAAAGQAQTNIPPSRPGGLTGKRTSATNVSLSWNPVTTKTDMTAVFINLYKVYRLMATRGATVGSLSPGAFALRGTTSTTTYVDTLSAQDQQLLDQGQAVYYIVTAADLCGNESQKDNPIEVSCEFSGSLVVSPGDGDANGGMIMISLSVIGSDTYTRARVVIPNPSLPLVPLYDQVSTTYPFSFPAWNSALAGPGIYAIHWEVENAVGCVQTLVTRFEVSENLACQISPSSPDIAPANGKPSDQNTRLAWDITNSSGKDLEIVTIAIAWTSILGPHRLMQIEYPEGTIVQTYTGGTTGPVLADFSFIPLLLRVNSGSGCSGSSCVRMAAVWDSKILAGGGIGEVLTITYAFRDPAGSLGACSFSVKPDLSFN